MFLCFSSFEATVAGLLLAIERLFLPLSVSMTCRLQCGGLVQQQPSGFIENFLVGAQGFRSNFGFARSRYQPKRCNSEPGGRERLTRSPHPAYRPWPRTMVKPAPRHVSVSGIGHVIPTALNKERTRPQKRHFGLGRRLAGSLCSPTHSAAHPTP